MTSAKPESTEFGYAWSSASDDARPCGRALGSAETMLQRFGLRHQHDCDHHGETKAEKSAGAGSRDRPEITARLGLRAV